MASGRLVSFCAPALAATGAGSPRENFKSFNQGRLLAFCRELQTATAQESAELSGSQS